jgi:hypothetical protein
MLALCLAINLRLYEPSFNDKVIDMLLRSRYGQIKKMDEVEATKAGFTFYRTSPFGLSFQTDGNRIPYKDDRPLLFATKESQDLLCEGIIKKLKLGFPNSQLTERGALQSREPHHALNRYFALEALVDGVQSLDDSISVVVDFHTGNIVSASASRTPDNRYIRVGQPLTDAELKTICLKHGLSEVSITKIWYPFNFVVRSKASDAHDRDNAIAIFAKYKAGTVEKYAMLNNLGEFMEEADIIQWQSKRLFGKSPSGFIKP